jgi:hypothetical protein
VRFIFYLIFDCFFLKSHQELVFGPTCYTNTSGTLNDSLHSWFEVVMDWTKGTTYQVPLLKGQGHASSRNITFE